MKKFKSFREVTLIQGAIDMLAEYYGCLGNEEFVDMLLRTVPVPRTGNDQMDYEAVRDRVENLCREEEAGAKANRDRMSQTRSDVNLKLGRKTKSWV